MQGYTAKDLQKELQKRDAQGVPYFSAAERLSFQNTHNSLAKQAGLTPKDVATVTRQNLALWSSLSERLLFLRAEAGDAPTPEQQREISYLEQGMKYLETSGSEQLMADAGVTLADDDEKGKASVDLLMRGLALGKNYDIDNLTDKQSLELHQTAGRILAEPSIQREDIPSGALKKGNVVTIRHFETGEEKTLPAREAKAEVATDVWEYVKTISTTLPKAPRPHFEEYAHTAGVPTQPVTRTFPRSVKKGVKLRDAEGTEYIIERIIQEGDVQKAVLQNLKTKERLTKRFNYDEILAKYQGVFSPIE